MVSILWGLWGLCGRDLGRPLGLGTHRCSCSLHPAGYSADAPRVHFSHTLIRYWPATAPWTIQRAAPGAPVSMARALRMDSS